MSGAAIGTYIATLLGVLPLQLYTGMWSFNSMLTMSYLGGHFWVLNGWAFPFSCVAGALLRIMFTTKFTRFNPSVFIVAAFATILCGLFYHVLGSVKLPFCGLPFFLSLCTFLLVASGTDMSFFIHRVRSPTYHERHLVDFLRHRSNNPAPSLYRDKKRFRLPGNDFRSGFLRRRFANLLSTCWFSACSVVSHIWGTNYLGLCKGWNSAYDEERDWEWNARKFVKEGCDLKSLTGAISFVVESSIDCCI